jgi:glutamate-5-semialdehyde dehydrogenase
MSEVRVQVEELCRRAKKASRQLALASKERKNELLRAMAQSLDQGRERILEANRKDLVRGREEGLSSAMLDRLELSEKRIQGMIQGIMEVIALEDPVGEVMKSWVLPSGLPMAKVRVPIGLIAIIFESRPNVTVDAGILCLKTGNGAVLRGGKEAIESNRVLVDLMQEASEKVGFLRETIALIPTTDREAITALCQMDQYVDLMIPRGGHALIEAVVKHARMPVIKHYHGVCHLYVHEEADHAMAQAILLNAKCQRPGVCNAVETLLVDASIAGTFLPETVRRLREQRVQILGDAAVSRALGEVVPEPENWTTEYLDLILAVRVVKGLDEALQHLEEFGSHHSDAIVTANQEVGERFLAEVDSATVYWNASTRFTDGGEFGFGAEIGISTDKIHARGPMALEELTSYKYVARGSGQVRK